MNFSKNFIKFCVWVLSISDLCIVRSEGNTPWLVIPKEFHHQIISNLHTANQDSISMIAHAWQVLYWPGMDRDINNHVEFCPDYQEIAPSKPNEPLIPAPSST